MDTVCVYPNGDTRGIVDTLAMYPFGYYLAPYGYNERGSRERSQRSNGRRRIVAPEDLRGNGNCFRDVESPT